MRILSFNIRQGGASRIDGVCSAVCGHKADIIIITEHRSNAAGRQLSQALIQQGLCHQTSSGPQGAENGVFIAARQPFRLEPTSVVPPSRRHWLGVEFDGFGLSAVYMPMNEHFAPVWEFVLLQARARLDSPYLIVGDMNTLRQREAGLAGPSYVDALVSLGYTDAWRKLHPIGYSYSWVNHNGTRTRIDYAFLSPPLAEHLVSARHSHAEIREKLSDHGALIVDLDNTRSASRHVRRFISAFSR